MAALAAEASSTVYAHLSGKSKATARHATVLMRKEGHRIPENRVFRPAGASFAYSLSLEMAVLCLLQTLMLTLSVGLRARKGANYHSRHSTMLRFDVLPIHQILGGYDENWGLWGQDASSLVGGKHKLSDAELWAKLKACDLERATPHLRP